MTVPTRWAPPGYALALTLVVTAPLFAPGYLLIRDAVSTPRSYLSDAALGLGESAPRAVPQDFAIAVLSAAESRAAGSASSMMLVVDRIACPSAAASAAGARSPCAAR